MQTNNPLICIVGPTACGKTHLAVHLAYLLNAEIISADSRQVYKHMDIGTGKDLNEYIVNGTAVAYHLIDIVEAGYQYNVFEYQRDPNCIKICAPMVVETSLCLQWLLPAV